MTDAAKRRIAQAIMVRNRYGESRAKDKQHGKPSLTVRPTGNPFKGKVGFKVIYKF